MKQILEKLPNVGSVDVTRVSTSHMDMSTWSFDMMNPESVPLNLRTNYELFVYDRKSFDWLITFVSRGSDIRLFSACCDEWDTSIEQDMTLRSAYSRDSKISIEAVQIGNIEAVTGRYTLSVNGQETDFIPLAADSKAIATALKDIGYDCAVTLIETDENSLNTYAVQFRNTTLPFLTILAKLDTS